MKRNANGYMLVLQKTNAYSRAIFLLLSEVPNPKLHFTDTVPAHYKQGFFTGPGDIQQVTDQANQHDKKPHREHNTSFNPIFSNTVPIKRG